MTTKFKRPSHIKPCEACKSGWGYHPEKVEGEPTRHLCDTCFRERADVILASMIKKWEEEGK
jgi:hypothetical protein